MGRPSGNARPHGAGRADDERELSRVTGSAREFSGGIIARIGTPAEIRAVSDLIGHIREQMDRLADEKKHEGLEAAVGAAAGGPDKPAQFKLGDAIDAQMGKDQEAQIQRLVAALAQYREAQTAGMDVTRKSGEDLSDWATRSNAALAAQLAFNAGIGPAGVEMRSVDEQVKEAAKDFKDMGEILKSLPSPINQAAAEWKSFDKALSELHLRDSQENLGRMREALNAIALHSGTLSTDYVEGWKQYTKALGEAAEQTGNFEQRTLGDLSTKIPQAFNQIENAISQDLIHWKGWADSIKSIFESLANDLLNTILKRFVSGRSKPDSECHWRNTQRAAGWLGRTAWRWRIGCAWRRRWRSIRKSGRVAGNAAAGLCRRHRLRSSRHGGARPRGRTHHAQGNQRGIYPHDGSFAGKSSTAHAAPLRQPQQRRQLGLPGQQLSGHPAR